MNRAWLVFLVVSLTARARGSRLLPYQVWLGQKGIPPMAHTSPIYLTVGGAAPWSPDDAAFLAAWVQRAINWAQQEANYETEGQRAEVVALYERAKVVFTNGGPGDER